MRYYCFNQHACGFSTVTDEPDEYLEDGTCPECYGLALSYLDHEVPDWLTPEPEIEDEYQNLLETQVVHRNARLFDEQEGSEIPDRAT